MLNRLHLPFKSPPQFVPFIHLQLLEYFEMASRFKVVQLPGNYDSGDGQRFLQALAQKSKALRLESLKTNPEAFSSTYENEVKFDDSKWEERLKSPSARTVVCLDLSGYDGAGGDVQTAAEAAWVGVIVLMGPRMLDGPYPPLDGGSLSSVFPAAPIWSRDSMDTKPRTSLYLINALYVTPSGRGKGLGRRMVEEVVAISRAEFDNDKVPGEDGACLVFAEKDNEAATRLYLACGFEVVGEDDSKRQNLKFGRAVGLMRKLGR
jgi:ribosomal protein S18 acetylase RimI-like enzyme